MTLARDGASMVVNYKKSAELAEQTRRELMPMRAADPASSLVPAEEAWERAYKEALTTAAWQHAEWLLESIGPRFTAAGIGVRDARTVRRWRDEHAEPRDQEEQARLQLMFRIVYAITLVYGRASVATSFLRSANPQLDDQAPLVLLASEPVDAVQRALLAATRAFLEG